MEKPEKTLRLVFILLMASNCYAQTVDRPDESHKPIQLPGAYSNFSEADILGKIFDGYDPNTKTVRNRENHPTKVSILEDKLWRAAGGEYLVVLTVIAPESLCGNCTLDAPLAVLKVDGTCLVLVAKQTLPAFDSSDGPALETFGPLSYNGHESIALDLAPYRLTDREMLIGVRTEHMWMPAPIYNTYLQLFRVRHGQLRKVFETLVIDREYPNTHEDGPQPILKTTSMVSTVRSGKQFFDLVVKRATVKCMQHEQDDCDSKGALVKPIRTHTEVWRFDGARFKKE
jgi:hypothetical protein